MKKYTLTFLLLIFSTSAAYAESQRQYRLITEDLFAPRHSRDIYDKTYRNYGYSTDVKNALLWHKTLLSLGIPSPEPKTERRYGELCHYDTALKILADLRKELGLGAPYLKIWAANQMKVFSACDDYDDLKEPTRPAQDNLPARAQSDYDYQRASWHFYNGEDDKALEIYNALSENKNAPMRALASYMIIRLLPENEAYKHAQTILADPSLSDVHNITTNQRFILMYYRDRVDSKTSEDHLRWLLKTITIDPFNTPDMDQAVANYFVALEHLDRYFPRYDDKRRVDWWLKDYGALKSSRMQVVRKLALEIEMVDWLQALWAYNIYQSDWLASLHAQNSDYWDQNRNIVNHAWQRYNQTHILEWLDIALQRVHPDNALAADILKEAEKHLSNPPDLQTHEYQAWQESIWKHAIRLKLGHKDFDGAIDLATDTRFHQKDRGWRWRQRYTDEYSSTINSTLRYLVYVGAFDHAKKLLISQSNVEHRPKKHWTVLLSQNAADMYPHSFYRNHLLPALLQAMMNRYSAEHQRGLIQGKTITTDTTRQTLSLVALTKAMILNKKDIALYAEIAANENITIKPDILRSVQRHRPYDYVQFMLRTPRMRLVPFFEGSHYQRNTLIPTQIDVYNHSDNNWWCAYNPAQLREEVFEQARITPSLWSPYDRDEHIQKQHEDHIKSLLAQHPYNQFTDPAEEDLLSKIPSGPQYLSAAVIKQETRNQWKFWRSNQAKNKSAANLHYAVKTTRYGCERNGSHAVYSRKAFEILHFNYGNSIWAEQTPYWFSDKHFHYLNRQKSKK